jgi:hypothetical protein
MIVVKLAARKYYSIYRCEVNDISILGPDSVSQPINKIDLHRTDFPRGRPTHLPLSFDGLSIIRRLFIVPASTCVR